MAGRRTRLTGFSVTLPQVPTLADFSSGDALPITASSSAASSSGSPNCFMRCMVRRADGPAITMTPVVGSPARWMGAAIELMPGA